MKKRFTLAMCAVLTVGAFLGTSVQAQPGHDPFTGILAKLDELLAAINSSAVDLRGVIQNWDKALPANDPGGSCPNNSSRFTCLFGGAAVRDNHTGLVWEQVPSSTTRTWRTGVSSDGSLSNAREECATKTIGGQRGWRLPSVHELASLINPTQSNPALAAGHPFSNVQTGPNGYWTATTDAEATAAAWAVNFFGGAVGVGDKTIASHVWCVRGGARTDQY